MSKRESLIGKKFNMLTVVEKISNYENSGRTYYKCKCDCGNYCFKASSNLCKDHAYSCGCQTRAGLSRRKDYTGEKFGMLTVTEMLYNYKYGQTYARCKCDCGTEKIIMMQSLKRGLTKSCGCLERSSRYGRPNHEKDLTNMRFGHLLVIEKTDKRYSNGTVGWLCECDCGNRLVVRSGSLIRGHTRSCGCNRMSKWEEYISEMLDEFKISYQREHRFPNCKNHFPLPFDFYIENYHNKDFCIEYQGQQHYEPVEHFGGEEIFEVRKKNDNIKKEYCENNNITLICLPYTLSKDEIKEILIDVLEPVTTTAA